MEKRIIINDLPTVYWIDTQGRLRNERTGTWLKGGINKGYHFYNVYFKGKQYTLYTHRLVAEYFLDNPLNYTIVHHRDGNKLNNNLGNLEWIDAESHGKHHGQGYYTARQNIETTDINIQELRQFRASPYWVSKDGRVFNLDKKIELRLEKSGNYRRFQGRYNLNGKHFLVHRVVWECFNGEIPEGYEINHIDRNGANNCLSNLELCTHTENCQKIKRPKNLPVVAVHISTAERKEFNSLSQAAREMTGDRSGVLTVKKAIERQEIWKDYRWYYKE